MSDPTYYARHGIVWKAPVETKNDDGTTTISIGFPVCLMHDAVGVDEPRKQESAEIVARLMNAGEVALAAEEQKP